MRRDVAATNRRGFGLALAILCTGLLALIFGAILAMVVRERLVVRTHERRAQAEWLAQAGVERAAQALRSNPSYSGETWKISNKFLAGGSTGRVTIAVAAIEGQPRTKRITAIADFPVEEKRRARARLDVDIDSEASKTEGLAR